MNSCASSTKTLISKWMKSHHCKSMLCASNIGSNISIPCQIHCSGKINSYYRFIPKVKDTENKPKALSHTYIKQLLQNCKSVKEQIEAFDSYVKLTDEDISLRNSVCQDIEKIFKPHFPNCSVHLTGSSVSGLGLKGCDVDLSFQPSTDELSEVSPIKDLSSDSVKDIKLGKVPKDSNFSSLLPRRQLHLLKNALMLSGAIKESAVVPGHCPILNFTYQDLNCDLAVDNKSALGGTNLMLLGRLLDDRVAPLYRFISYWAKYLHLCGGPMRLKSYAIFLLVVYFLQTKSPPVLPTVQFMFDKTDFISNQNNWSYDVSKYIDKFERSQNSQSLDVLLQEFFFFYTKFDFSNVICPLANRIENARDFISKNHSEEKFMVTEISVQDPLNSDWNVTSGCSRKYSRLFKQDLSLICKTYNAEEYWQPGVENWGLLSLFEILNTRKANKK